MEKFLLRLLLIIVLISFGVFYGIDMAGRGMNNVQEVQEENMELPPIEIIEIPESNDQPEHSFTYEIIESEVPQTRNGWAGKLGKLLQNIAHGAVEGINSVFDRIIA